MKNILIIFLLSSCVSFSQEDSSFVYIDSTVEYNRFKEHVPYWRLEKYWKFSPFDVFSIVPTFGVDHELKMNKNFSFQFGAAVIPTFTQFLTGNGGDQFNWMNGYRLRFESRWYGFNKPWLYVATELSMRHLIINEETAFGMEGDGNGNFAWFINQEMIYHRFSTHVNGKIGWQFILGNNLAIDTYVGLSLRRNNVISNSTPPEGGVPQENWWNLFEWRLVDGHKFGYAIPILGFKIGWQIPAKKAIG